MAHSQLGQLDQLFHLPWSDQAFSQLQSMMSYLESLNLDNDCDLWRHVWDSNIFSASKAYKSFIWDPQVHHVFRWLWRTYCQPKYKVFFWLLLKDRLSTRNILRRKSMHLESYNCELCRTAVEETLSHLFLECPSAKSCWGILNLNTPAQSNLPEVVFVFKNQLNSEFFLNVVILMCWTIWGARNDLIFNGVGLNLQNCKTSFRKELALTRLRAKDSTSQLYNQWIQIWD